MATPAGLTGTLPWLSGQVTLSDLNADGKADLAVANYSSGDAFVDEVRGEHIDRDQVELPSPFKITCAAIAPLHVTLAAATINTTEHRAHGEYELKPE